MKIYKIFIFLLLLSPSQPTWACIDDPEEYYDDNYDDDWDDWDEDDDWSNDVDDDWLDGGELPEVTVIGHYYDEEVGSSLDDYEDYIDGVELLGPTIFGHSPDNSNNNESEDNDNEEDEWNWDYDDEEEGSSSNESSSSTSHLTMISAPLPIRWVQSTYRNSCVVTSMEYVWNIVNKIFPPDQTQRYVFENIYSEINSKYNYSTDGVSLTNMEIFFSIVFQLQELDYEESFRDAIEFNHPILSTISGMSDGEECLHEIVVIGYNDYDDVYICVDPTDGNYYSIDYSKIVGKSYSIIGIK